MMNDTIPQSELQRRLERDVLAVVPEDADLAIQQRDSLCRAAGTRRKKHSRYFSETAYSKLTGDNKELLIIFLISIKDTSCKQKRRYAICTAAFFIINISYNFLCSVEDSVNFHGIS